MVPDSSEEEFVQQRVTYSLEWAGRFVVVENVAARVSLRTGEKFFSPETVERLQQIVWEQRTPVRVIETPVFQYPSAVA
jgi:hypothetical protein